MYIMFVIICGIPVVQLTGCKDIAEVRAGRQDDDDAQQDVVGHLVATHFADLFEDAIEVYVTGLGLCSHHDAIAKFSTLRLVFIDPRSNLKL